MDGMANRVRPDYEGIRLAREQLMNLGRELRVARILAGKRQADVARAIGASKAQVCRIEHARVLSVSHLQLARFAGAVGLRLWARVYPAGRRLMDAPQLGLFGRWRARAGGTWKLETEVVMPIEGDLRAADAVARIPRCTVVIEVITRLADVQAQVRSARLKKRDLGADRLVLLVAGSRANRRALAEAGDALNDSFPLGTREVLRAMEAGQDPGADGIVLL